MDRVFGRYYGTCTDKAVVFNNDINSAARLGQDIEPRVFSDDYRIANLNSMRYPFVQLARVLDREFATQRGKRVGGA